ncbi:MAG: hypothetical protein AB7F88_18355 [Pyrinomonadaceae bacterium]
MQTLKIRPDDELTDAELVPIRFWKRQFHLEPTARQRRFDWTFGVILPTICVAADPIVFSSSFGEGDALLGRYKIFAYLLSSVSIMAMAAWLLWGQRLGYLRPYLGGLFLAGSVISLIVGAILLPFSLIGMFLLIGFLGFTPLFSGFVYLRNGVRAINGAKADTRAWAVYQAVILAALYSLIVPFVLNF